MVSVAPELWQQTVFYPCSLGFGVKVVMDRNATMTSD